MRRLIIRSAAIAVGACLGTSAMATDLVTAPEAAMYLQPPTSNGQLQTRIGDESVLNPSWSIIQQGAPMTIPAGGGQNYLFPAGTDWQLSQGSSFRVQFHAVPLSFTPGVGNLYELAQNSFNGACTGDASRMDPGNEWILLAQSIPPGPPYGSGYKYPDNTQVPSRASRSAPLSQISHVLVQVGVTIPYEQIGSGCYVNASGYNVGLGIRNTANNQLIFYYIGFRDSRGYTTPRNPCYANEPDSNGNYCYNVSAQYVGGPSGNQPVSENRIFYNMDAYSDIVDIINKNPNTDKSLGNWVIEPGATFGPRSVGQVNTVSLWDSFKLSAY